MLVRSIALSAVVLMVGSSLGGCSDKDSSSTQASQRDAVTSGQNWFPIGPTPIEFSQIYSSSTNQVKATGRATVIAVNPAKTDEVFLGTAAGGLWHTRDALDPDPVWSAGISGTNNFKSAAIGAIAVDSSTCTAAGPTCGPAGEICGCSVVWVGTGENGRRRDTHYGAGVYRLARRGSGEFTSFDFQEVANTATAFSHGNVFKILPESADTALVVVSEGVTANSTHATVIAPAPSSGYGLFRISESANSVTNIPVSGSGTAFPTDLERRPDQPQTLFMGYSGAGVFRSTDNGAHWCGLNSGAGTLCSGASGLTPTTPFFHVELAVSPADNNVVFASFGKCFNRTGNSCGLNSVQVFRSLDGGTTWAALSIGLVEDSTQTGLQSYPSYTHVLSPHPTNAQQFYLGGLVMYNCSNTGGTTAYTCTGFGSDDTHPDIHDIVSLQSGSTIYAATDGGFYSSLDSGSSFTSPARHLNIAAFQSVAVSPGTEDIIGGLQDNANVTFSGTSAMKRFQSGDGGDTVLDVVNDGGTTRTVKYAMVEQATTLLRSATGLSSDSVNIATNTGDTAAFYWPLEQHPTTHDLYYGRQALFKSTDTDAVRGDSFSVISPAFGDTTTRIDAIETQNNITAIGLAPSNANFVYVGNYNGQVFVSSGGAGCPSTSASCWTQIAGTGVTTNITIPTGPITSFSVNATTPSTVYMTVSGFGNGPHVLRNTAAAANGWEDLSQGLPANTPVNVVRIGLSDPTELWLGTEVGLFHRVGATPWEQEGGVFPSVPIYDVAVDSQHSRVVAATHGRGLWLRTTPTLRTLEGWAMGTIWDIPITGVGFLNTSSSTVTCNVELVQQNGTVCASGSVDARGGTAQVAPNSVDSGGTLVTSNGGGYNGLPVFWGCFNGNCINNTPISHCNFVLDGSGNPTSTPNPVTAVRVTCPGSPVAVGQVSGAPAMTAPPPNIFQINLPPPAGMPLRVSNPAGDASRDIASGSGTFDVAVSLQSGSGITRQLCHTRVDFSYTETEDEIMERVANQLNADADCIAAGAVAHFDGPDVPEEIEDEFEKQPNVVVTAPTLVGSRILTTMRVLPGSASGVCFTADDLLSMDVGQSTIMKLKPSTASNGAAGGSLTITERTGIGTCSRIITTTAGQTATQLASAIASAFEDVTSPGTADCLANANARDLSSTADSVFAAFADRFTLCSNDEGVGFTLGPDEIDLSFNKPPVAVCKDATITANSACQGSVSASDVNNGSVDPDGPTPNCTLNATGPFPLGTRTLTLTCTDNEGASASCTSQVTVVDATKPVLNCPTSVNTLCTSPSGAVSSYTVSAQDNCSGSLQPTCTLASGAQYALGTRVNNCSVTDASGNRSTCSFNISVLLGDNPVCCPAGTNVIVGTSNNDNLNGGSGRDCIFGRGGQDTINGNGGDDLISGGDGDDIISGGDGNDFLCGGAGQDRVSGNLGNDFMSGGDGDDTCFGGDNSDMILGGNGQDQLFGENGDDTLVGEAGDDRLDGGNGNDSLDGSGVHDVCIGGPGTDVFLVCQSQTQ